MHLKCLFIVIAELPETMCLNFDCGAQIKLGFAAEFSNVLVIYTHIIKKPEEMSFCQAHVTDFSQVRELCTFTHIATCTFPFFLLCYIVFSFSNVQINFE